MPSPGLISLPFGGIQFVVARFVAVDATTGDTARMGAFIRRAVIATAIVAAALSVVLTIASPLLQNALGVGGLTPVVLTTLYTLPALLAPTFWGVAQGLQRFGLLSASMVAGTFVRIGIVVALIPFGIGVGGVMGATLVSAFATLLVPLPLVFRLWRSGAMDESSARRGARMFALPVMAGTLAITSLTTVDLIVAKISLSNQQAGIYGSASFIGRLLLYLPTTVATVLLPKVTSRAAADQDTHELLSASLAVTAAFSLAGTALLVVLPHLVVNATFGAKYSDATPLLGLFGLAMTNYALLNVLLVYHLGRGRPAMAWLLLGGAVAQLAIYGAVHGSTYQLVTVNLVSSLILLAIHEIAFETTLPGAVRWAWAKAR